MCRSELTTLRFKKKKCACSNCWPIPVFPKLVLRSCVMSWTFCFDQERRAPPPVPKKPAKGPAPLIRERSLESSQRQEARKRLMAAKRAASVRQNSATESAESIEIYIPEAQTRLWAPRRAASALRRPPAPCPPSEPLCPGAQWLPLSRCSCRSCRSRPPVAPAARPGLPTFSTELRPPPRTDASPCLIRRAGPFFSWQNRTHLCRHGPCRSPTVLSSPELVCP